MVATKLLTALFLGVLAVQAKPQLKDAIDDIIRDLQDLDREATTEQQQASDRLKDELRSIEEFSQNILQHLGDDLTHDEATLLVEISALEDRAYELGVDIRECVGNSPDEIAKLSEQLRREAENCIDQGHGQAEHAVEDGVRQITEAVGPIDEYWRQVERCREADRREQDICVAELNSEIKNDQIQIPARIHLAVEEVVGHLEAEKAALLLCPADKAERLNEEGGRIVRRVTECAERLFPPEPTPFK